MLLTMRQWPGCDLCRHTHDKKGLHPAPTSLDQLVRHEEGAAIV
jgi:hypothetical protein